MAVFVPCNVSPLPLSYFQSFFLHTIVLFIPSVTFNHPSVTRSVHFNGPPIISPPSNILSKVPPSPHRTYLQSRGSLVIPRSCRVPFHVPSICTLLGNPSDALARMLMSRFASVFVALGVQHGLRGAALLTGVGQGKTVRLGVFRVKEGAGGSRFIFGRVRDGTGASLKHPLE